MWSALSFSNSLSVASATLARHSKVIALGGIVTTSLLYYQAWTRLFRPQAQALKEHLAREHGLPRRLCIEDIWDEARLEKFAASIDQSDHLLNKLSYPLRAVRRLVLDKSEEEIPIYKNALCNALKRYKEV